MGVTKLDAGFFGTRQDFLAVHSALLHDYQEQTINQPDTQLVEPQMLNCLQEAVRSDGELNRL
jgi:hypothetical protein